MTPEARITGIRARAYTIPTDKPEADGTIAWDKTTIVIAEADAGGKTGIGYTYADASIVPLIEKKLKEAVAGVDAMDVPSAFRKMTATIRNLGHPGLVATAISAVDGALWDLKGKLLDLPLCQLLGKNRDAVPIYGSGGFTTYDDAELREQLGGWVHRDGCAWVKMKIGSEPDRDPARVAVARSAIGERPGLFIDANGAFDRKQAIVMAERCVGEGVMWFEEPVSSDDLEGMHFVRNHVPSPVQVAAGEYGYTLDYFRRMLEAQAVDVLQADVTRCGGITGWLAVEALTQANHIDLSAHCAPAMHLHAACSARRLRHLEWFHDHVRIEQMLFDGAPYAKDGAIRPDLSRPGLGLTLKERDAARYQVGGG
ncbi:MAG: mandelate racemase [Rhodospirillales bacterium 69-11]|nr:mandelate racemase [Rhodospirillales bacterium]OJW29586.1 MAG: mandelate racemase [Rhodospirillales bacterium 69-11]